MRFLKRRWAEVLIAEDDATYGGALRSLLEMEGYSVRLVADGEAAVRCLDERGEQLDLLLCDLLLPRRSGFDVIKEVVARELSLPVLAVTGVYSNFREIHALRGLGVAGYVHKSTPFEHVLFRINNLLFPSRDNQRGDPRVAVAIPVQFVIGDRTCYGTSYNLSVSGIYVRTPEPVLPGALTELALSLPTAIEMISVTAEIVHSASPGEVRGTAYPAGFGARFLEPTPVARTAIRRFVESVHAEETGEATQREPEPTEVGS